MLADKNELILKTFSLSMENLVYVTFLINRIFTASSVKHYKPFLSFSMFKSATSGIGHGQKNWIFLYATVFSFAEQRTMLPLMVDRL